jgi:hypothetical protein
MTGKHAMTSLHREQLPHVGQQTVAVARQWHNYGNRRKTISASTHDTKSEVLEVVLSVQPTHRLYNKEKVQGFPSNAILFKKLFNILFKLSATCFRLKMAVPKM